MKHFQHLSRQELLKVIACYGKNWLAHDGCWFLAAEEKYDLETAIQLDSKSWERFTVAEAKRIMKTFELPRQGGLKTLEEALKYRLYAAVNIQESNWTEDGKLHFFMRECRVQLARRRKGLPDFPCKPVGLIEYSGFAATIDERIKTKCLTCPPDPQNPDHYCAWEFWI